MAGTTVSRRDALRLIGGTALACGTGFPARLLAAETVTVINYGFVLGIHCPATRGLVDECPKLGIEVQMQRFQRARDIVQTVIGGSGDIAVTEPSNTLRSVQAGNDLTIFGNYYLHTDNVLVVNTDHVKEWSDFTRPDVNVGINSQGDNSQVIITGGLSQHGVDPKKVRWIDVGGSGSRTRALLANRIQAAMVHVAQVREIQKTGNYAVMLEPAKAYDPWVNEVVYARSKWLLESGNREKAVGVMKGIITAHREATKSFEYYRKAFHDYTTLKAKDTMTEAELRSEWDRLANELGAWPADNNFKRSNFENLMPHYVAATAVEDKPIDLGKVIDVSIVEDALAQLG